MKIEEIKSSYTWIKDLDGSTGYNFFMYPEWLELVANIFDFKNTFFKISDNEDIYYMDVQSNGKTAYSNFIGYGGPILKSSGGLSLGKTLELKGAIENHAGFVLSRIKLGPDRKYALDSNLFNTDQAIIVPIMNSGLDQEYLMSKKLRTSVKFAVRNGVQIKSLNKDNVEHFFKIYEETMSRVKSVYVTPIELFKGLLEMRNARILGAFLNDSLIAGSIFMFDGSTMYYWWNASNETGRKYCANHLIIREAIKLASYMKLESLDMATSHGSNIMSPKMKWGGEPKHVYIYES